MDHTGQKVLSISPRQWIASLVILLIGIGLLLGRNAKQLIFFEVKRNQIEFTQIAENLLQGDIVYDRLYERFSVSYYGGMDYVEFRISEAGFGSSTTYKGFYYSPNDSLIGFQATNMTFVEYNNGWISKEQTGDNYEYIEKITDCWYWFEMHF